MLCVCAVSVRASVCPSAHRDVFKLQRMTLTEIHAVM